MKKLISTYLLRLFAAALTVVSAAACTDDAGLPEVASQGTSVTLRIPNPAAASASRAADPDPAIDADAKEGAIHSLWLLAYNSDGTNHVITRLQSSGQLTHEYSDYKVEFKPGTYSMYVVANLDPYISKVISTSTTESELDGLILNFSSEKLPNLSDGLPMACLPTEIDGNTDGTITINAGDSRTIQADLTFLCAKVRYTILFDNSGFSKEAFGDNSVTFNSASLSGIIASTALMTPAVTSTTGAFAIDKAQLTETVYPADVDNPGKLPANTSTPAKARRAWQGTIYLPENRLTGNYRTTLSLGATLDGNGAELAYTIRLPKSDDKAADNTLLRGNFYDLIGRVTTIGERIDLTATVKDWTLQKLTYDLHGPYFLHVDKTTIADMVAGREQLLYYETDAPELKFESYQYQDKDLFTVTTVKDEATGNDYISVKVNPEIEATGKTLEDDDYYFDIIAANLHKRILVTPIYLTPFLNVTPTEIVVNIAEHIASGEYEGTFEVSFDTNLPEVKITGFEGWDNSIISLEGESILNTASGKNTIKVSGMNDGKWTAETTFTLTYTATPASGKPITKEVTITVKPNRLNYLIHFRAPSDWTHPHIYVYQCLQLPQNTENEFAGKTVGYENGENSYYSALEYSFTGKISFLGWNYNDPTDPNYYKQSGSSALGFCIFNDSYKYLDHWIVDKNYNDNKHYNTTLDLCKAYRDSITECTQCKSKTRSITDDQGNRSYGFNSLWPGILMRNDNNGWWTFELTGVATPGKALIMFADRHGGSNKRFPADKAVGIPLFDHPSREGWFDYANGSTQFSSTKPKTNKYRIYWPNTNSTNNAFIHIWVGNRDITTWGTSTGKLDSDYYYYDFELLESYPASTVVNYQLKKAGAYANKKVTLDKFKKIEGEDIYAITLDNNDNFTNSGKPGNSSSDPFDSKIYRVYWRDNNDWNRCHVWVSFNNTDTPNPAAPNYNSDAQNYTGKETRNGVAYKYFQFTSTKEWNADTYSFQLYYSVNSGNNSSDQKNKYFYVNNSGDSSYDYYYEYN